MISSSSLIQNGWVKKENYYRKGKDILFYDGVHWELNGKKLVGQAIEDIFVNHSVSFNPTLPEDKNQSKQK